MRGWVFIEQNETLCSFAIMPGIFYSTLNKISVHWRCRCGIVNVWGFFSVFTFVRFKGLNLVVIRGNSLTLSLSSVVRPT